MTSKLRDVELNPGAMYANLVEGAYKAELELLDRYLQFAAELLRLALLAIALIGFAYEKHVLGLDNAAPSLKGVTGIAVFLFALSAGLSVAYRYFATEAFRSYTRGLRLQVTHEAASSSGELHRRDRLLWWCIRLKASAAITLVLGTLLLSGVIALLVAG